MRASPRPLAERIGRALDAGTHVVHLREREAGAGAATAVAALETDGRGAVVTDLTLVARAPEPELLLRAVARETLIRGAGLVAGPVEALADGHVESIQVLSEWPSPVVFVGAATWDSLWSSSPPLSWRHRSSVRGSGSPCCDPPRAGWCRNVDPDSLAAHLSLGPPRSSVLSTPPVRPPRSGPEGSRPRTSAVASGPRTQPAWSAWHVGSSPR